MKWTSLTLSFALLAGSAAALAENKPTNTFDTFSGTKKTATTTYTDTPRSPRCYLNLSMIQLELQPEVESRLASEAEARGLSLDRYIESIVTARPAATYETQPRTPERQREIEGAIERILELREKSSLDGLKIKDLINEGRKY